VNCRTHISFTLDQVIKWPAERKTRLVARVLHNRQGKVSSAVFGTQTSSDVNTRPTGEKPSASIASAVKSKPHKNPKARQNIAPEVKHNIAGKLRMIKGNQILEANGLMTRPSKNKMAESKSSNLLTVTDLKESVTEEKNEELNINDVFLPMAYTPQGSRCELLLKSPE
jgi:hypothetical protein